MEWVGVGGWWGGRVLWSNKCIWEPGFVWGRAAGLVLGISVEKCFRFVAVWGVDQLYCVGLVGVPG